MANLNPFRRSLIGLKSLLRFGASEEQLAHTECSVAFEDDETDRRPRVMLSLFGLDDETLSRLVMTTTARIRAGQREPIFLVDRPCLGIFRSERVVVEILPSAEMLGDQDPTRYRAYIAGKLDSIRESWLPVEEIQLGDAIESIFDVPMLDPVDDVAQGRANTQ